MKDANKNKTLQWVGIGCIAILVVTCICVGIVSDTFTGIGEILTAPIRWLQGLTSSPADLNLAQAIDRGESAQFTLGSGCQYSNAQGTTISSQPDVEQGQDFSEDMPADQVQGLAAEALAGMVFSIQDGQVTLATGEPVQVEKRADGLYLSVEQRATAEGVVGTHSLQGTAEGDTFTGSLYLSDYTSTVISGEGVERQVTASVDVTCPITLQGK